MRAIENVRTAAEVLVDQLIKNGVRHVFCVPGESYLAVLDAFHDRDITVTVCRQEGGAAMMAEAVGKATGRPGVCFVTRGPGATNASPGIHIAQQDSTPLIMFAGQVARDVKGREALQELDYRAAFGGMAKWVTEIDDAARVPEIVSRAFYTATNGRPGPVVIALPEDMLRERVVAADRRRQPLVGGGARGDAAVRQALRVAGCDQLSPAAAVRSAASLLRGRPRYRAQSQACRANQECRSGPAGRRTSRRARFARLQLVRHPRTADQARACASGRRGTRPPLSASPGDPCEPNALRGSGRSHATARLDCLARAHANSPRGLSGMDR